jgi:hypothetical protein
MHTIEQVITGCANLTEGDTLKIKGLVSSDLTVRDITATLLPPGGYKEMQREDWKTITEALSNAVLGEVEIAAATEMLKSLDRSLGLDEGSATSFSGPKYERDQCAPVHRLPSSPDAIYFLRLRKEGPVEGGKPPKGAVPLAKFELTRKLQLATGNYIHAIKLQDGLFESLEIV